MILKESVFLENTSKMPESISPQQFLGGEFEELNWNCYELHITMQIMTAHHSRVLSKSQVESHV
jgi:hypothetical protein